MTDARSSIAVVRARPAWLLPVMGGLGLLLLYVVIVSRFSPFLSGYGDDVAYVGTPGFLWSSYQPLWGTVAGSVFRAAGLDGVMLLQAVLYAVSVALVMGSCWRTSRVLAWSAGVFMVVNLQAAFYIASPLTETMSLFLFSLGLWAWQMLDPPSRAWRWPLLSIVAASVVAVALARAGDAALGPVLLALTLVRVVRRDRGPYRLALVALVPAVAVTALWTWSLQSQPNATGINLYRFVLAACAHATCPTHVLTGADTPVTRDHVLETGSLAGLDQAFVSATGSVWTDRFGEEMRTVYLKLVREAPGVVIVGAVRNVADQLRATTQPAYPEDPNATLLTTGWGAAVGAATLAVSRLLALMSPLVAAYATVRVVVRRRVPMLLTFCLAWLVTELVMSQWLYAGILLSEAPRMRLHYVVPAIVVSAWSLRDLQRALTARRSAAQLDAASPTSA